MDLTQFITLTTTGFVVAFLHASIPTHWLAFVGVGRARNWSKRRTLFAVALAGSGHVLVTTALGIALAYFGFELNIRFSHTFHWLVAGLLVGVGIWLIVRSGHGSKGHHHGPEPTNGSLDKTVILTLFLGLSLTPCGLLLPVYLTAVPLGWIGVLWLSLVLALATLGGMLTLTWLTLSSLDRVKWRWFSKVDGRAIGGLLCMLGVASVVFGH